VAVTRGDATRVCRAVSDGDRALLDEGAVMSGDALATCLAGVVGLAPRPRRPVPELVVVDAQLLEEHLRGGGGTIVEAREALALSEDVPDELAGALGALPRALVGRLRVAPVGFDAVPPPVEALDGGPTGWWQILVGGGEDVTLAASSGRLLWEQLVLLTGWLTDSA